MIDLLFLGLLWANSVGSFTTLFGYLGDLVFVPWVCLPVIGVLMSILAFVFR
ncbi:hypothetical protein [Deinococcus fonticola]|uniref:hypothetical protein n=1 Tax=Deinococcus fonticola TaxID=2528713 RepID=UPI0014300682|nr:hypothetical protein [Deinococcus fonticola]